jgi:hypothetical protein
MRTFSRHAGTGAARPAARCSGLGIRIVAVAMLAASSLLLLDLHAQAAPGDKGLTARVLLYSGRPDPTFEITNADEIAQLRALFKQATPEQKAQGESVIPSKLGYKGFIVENPGNVQDLPARLIVYGGALELGTEHKRFLSDPGARVEAFLLDIAVQRGVIPENVLSRLRDKR